MKSLLAFFVLMHGFVAHAQNDVAFNDRWMNKVLPDFELQSLDGQRIPS